MNIKIKTMVNIVPYLTSPSSSSVSVDDIETADIFIESVSFTDNFEVIRSLTYKWDIIINATLFGTFIFIYIRI